MPRLGIVGATGIVGQELLALISDSKFADKPPKLAASSKSAGAKLDSAWGRLEVESVSERFFSQLDFCFFCVEPQVSQNWIPRALAKNVVCVDNSSAYRMNAAVPIVIPEVNGRILETRPQLIANPNCSTAQLTVALNPIHQAFGLKNVFVSTYQSVSGAGFEALKQLYAEAQSFSDAEADVEYEYFFNVRPLIGGCDQEGICQEELKIIQETRKILEQPELPIAVTTARVGVPRSHCQAVTFVTEKDCTVERLSTVLAEAENIVVTDDPVQLYPGMCSGRNTVSVGRIRANKYHQDKSFSIWVSADNLRKGAAHNALSIVETWCGVK
ncbi:MAG: aspartate-semialdehyde dehydrogenase [Firmicutes bacterium]|nr:aspartate-semialdehyde dehydrogenase [Bacillota bacterium]